MTDDSKVFTVVDQETLEPGFYWIKRCEPDGPPYWEVAKFVRSGHYEHWYTAGSPFIKSPTHNSTASNAWRIGPRLEPPTS